MRVLCVVMLSLFVLCDTASACGRFRIFRRIFGRRQSVVYTEVNEQTNTNFADTENTEESYDEQTTNVVTDAQPNNEAKVVEQPIVEQPNTDAKVVEQPKAEYGKVAEQPKTDAKVIEQPKSGSSGKIAEQPKAKQPKPQQVIKKETKKQEEKSSDPPIFRKNNNAPFVNN